MPGNLRSDDDVNFPVLAGQSIPEHRGLVDHGDSSHMAMDDRDHVLEEVSGAEA
jgi:hypothetical protein